MSTHKYMDKICCLALLLALVVTGVFLNAPSLGIQAASTAQGYESRLFDTSRVHTIDIVEQRLFGKGKDKQAEIQYSCGFAAGWLPKS